MRPLALALLLAAPALAAGCLDAPAGGAAESAAADAEGADATLAAGEAFRWDGALRGPPRSSQTEARAFACWAHPCPDPAPSCPREACARVPLRVDVPADHWGAHEGALEVSVRWRADEHRSYSVRIEDAQGQVLAWGRNAYPWAYGRTAVLRDPAPGAYVAVVVAEVGKGAYEALAEVESRPRPEGPRELLPDLVTLPPTDLRLETDMPVGVSYFAFPAPGVREALGAAGVKGCRVDEAVESQGRRCLRFSNAVGNVGEGPLEVRLDVPGAAGRFVQRVYASDGTHRDAQAGAAEWHATHAHWHNAAANRFWIRAYDPETGAAGEDVGEGRKGGICFADLGLVDLGLPFSAPAAYSGYACFDPRGERAWVMGVAPGWYDLYAYALADQFVDVTGLPDGTYQLCSVTNSEGTLLESNLSGNEACTAFRLSGDAVETLDPPPYHSLPRGA